MTFFYDTCALLNKMHKIFESNDKFFISVLTLSELENIKTSGTKDPDTRFKARKLIHMLKENESKYEVVLYQSYWDSDINDLCFLSNNNDSKIIMSALKTQDNYPSLIFVTEDYCCGTLATAAGLTVLYESDKPDDYTGFVTLRLENEDKIAEFYNELFMDSNNPLNMLINQYLLIEDVENHIIDKYKWTEDGFKKVPYNVFDSKQFGAIKPKDDYQQLVMDSMKKNKITMIRGAAGTGKSYISVAYLFECLEKGTIDKIIIFCNTVATNGAAKLGYYPGTRDEKLLDSQIGNFLSSKLGDKFAVEKMIDDGTLVLLPMSDIRGYDTSGMKAGIYITEAQNLDIELMRLALQRIGESSICILDGDSDAQVDASAYAGENNGMRRVSEVFRGDPVYGEVTLQNIYRSRIARIAQRL